MTRPEGLDHSVLRVGDAERASAFYRDVLGATIDSLSLGRLRFRIGTAALHVHAPGSTPFPHPAHTPGPGSGDFCFVWPGTPDEVLGRLAAHGIEVVAGPVAREGARGPGMSVYFHDPDGNLLELMSYAETGR